MIIHCQQSVNADQKEDREMDLNHTKVCSNYAIKKCKISLPDHYIEFKLMKAD